ncbi:MAG: DEAD/DEAH box helicase [Pirellulaceae bacterium]|nr:DEAD/DEAH box helicase [Pirellulaceae bacterium]
MFAWQPTSGLLSTSTWDADIHRAAFYVCDLSSLLSPPILSDIESPDLTVLSPTAVALKIPRAAPRVTSFTFPEAPAWMQPQPSPPGAKPQAAKGAFGDAMVSSDQSVSSLKRPTITRIKPPGDVIKLEDRLYYVLQPPLETLIQSDALHFPFEPFPYQYQGVAFLYPRYAAVLADEMGLGKTMQSITAIRMLLRAGEIRSILLICPKPLVTNWKREFGMWAPEIPISIIEGDASRRHWLWQQDGAPVKIANYELLMRDKEEVLGEGMHFDLVMLDEAQRIKNINNTTSEIVRAIPRTRNWALTGTPIENSPDDIVGIFEFLSPGYMRTGMPAKRLGELARDYILRRTKEIVLTDMPPKMFRDAELDLSPEQRATYEIAENEGVVNLNELGDSISIQHVFELVLRLKQICNFDPSTGTSSKLERLEADLEEVAASGRKAIVFSQWVNSIEIIAKKLDRFGPLQYHGKIPSKQRDPILKQFKEDKSKHVILMSYGAGSVGLNLQFCEYVFLFDRWWNPAIEDQAINRAHRIGVTGPVTVTRMLALGTIEERINQILEHKRELFNSIMNQTGGHADLRLTQQQIFGLFNLRTPKGPIKQAA